MLGDDSRRKCVAFTSRIRECIVKRRGHTRYWTKSVIFSNFYNFSFSISFFFLSKWLQQHCSCLNLSEIAIFIGITGKIWMIFKKSIKSGDPCFVLSSFYKQPTWVRNNPCGYRTLLYMYTSYVIFSVDNWIYQLANSYTIENVYIL